MTMQKVNLKFKLTSNMIYSYQIDSLLEWDVQEVKEWAKSMFNEEVAENFEREEIDGTTLQSKRILSDESRNSLGLSTIGKKDKFVVAVKKLFGKS